VRGDDELEGQMWDELDWTATSVRDRGRVAVFLVVVVVASVLVLTVGVVSRAGDSSAPPINRSSTTRFTQPELISIRPVVPGRRVPCVRTTEMSRLDDVHAQRRGHITDARQARRPIRGRLVALHLLLGRTGASAGRRSSSHPSLSESSWRSPGGISRPSRCSASASAAPGRATVQASTRCVHQDRCTPHVSPRRSRPHRKATSWSRIKRRLNRPIHPCNCVSKAPPSSRLQAVGGPAHRATAAPGFRAMSRSRAGKPPATIASGVAASTGWVRP